MAIYLKNIIQVQCTTDSNQTTKYFFRDGTAGTVTCTTFTAQHNGTIYIGTQQNEDLSLGDVTAVKGIYIEVNGDATLKLNGGNETLAMRANEQGIAKFFFEGDITAVNLYNPSVTTVLEGLVFMWGNAA